MKYMKNISVYFVTRILNIVSPRLWHTNINKKNDKDAFDLQKC